MQARRHKCLERLCLALYVRCLSVREVQLKVVRVNVQKSLALEDFNNNQVELLVALSEQVFRISGTAIRLIPSKRGELGGPRRIVVSTVRAVRHRTNVVDFLAQRIHKDFCLRLVKLLGKYLKVGFVFTN